MVLFTLAFLMGDLYLQTFSQLPAKIFIYLPVIVMFFIYLITSHSSKNIWRYAYLPLAFTLGLAWSFWYASSLLAWVLPKEMEGKHILVTGYIASLPTTDRWQTHFLFRLNNKITLQLFWRDVNNPLTVGDKWQLLVRLKRIHGTQNPGAFDFEAWALQKGLRAIGTVLPSEKNKRLSQNKDDYPIYYPIYYSIYYSIDRWRQLLQEKIKAAVPQSKTTPWLTALIIGEREGISQKDWQVLRNTGTNHLMAIAGLHIGILAGFVYAIFSWVWRRFPVLIFIFPAQHAGACAALVAAVLYSALAGFSLPTQRACIMLFVIILALLSRRKIQHWHAWSLAMLLVLLLNPLSVLTDSFWLSFGTIALIIYGMNGRLAPLGFRWKWTRIQWFIGVGLIPLTLFLFQQVSLLSFLANSLAIPWLSFFILPFCFLSGIFLIILPSLGTVFLTIAHYSLTGLWMMLTWFSALPFATWHPAMPSSGIIFITLVGCLFLLLPTGFPGKWVGFFWLIPLLFYQPIKPIQGDFWVTLLDVGQGLSVVVQTKTHTLVYDAGPKYQQADMGERVVLPYLYMVGTKQIDQLIVSHGDNDHKGGTQALFNALPIKEIKSSVPQQFSSASYCLAGDAWRWDHVNFKFLYPTLNYLQLANDSSCVLLIDNGKQRVLLTGDIEKYAENNLLTDFQYGSKAYSNELAATILIAPHHGSKTSGLAAFIEAVHPTFVLYATGYRNRYHFPHPSVVKTYSKMHAIQLNTAYTGAIQFKLQKDNARLTPDLYRVSHKRYWQ